MHPCNLGCTVLVTLWAVWVLMVFIAKYHKKQKREADTSLKCTATKVGKVKDNDVLHLVLLGRHELLGASTCVTQLLAWLTRIPLLTLLQQDCDAATQTY